MTAEALDADDDLSEVLKKVVSLVTREHRLTGNQLHELASQLERMATYRIVEEQIRRYRHLADD